MKHNTGKQPISIKAHSGEIQIPSTLASPYFMADTITIFTTVKTVQINTETDFILSF